MYPLSVQLSYLAGVVLFVVGLKQLSSPRTARQGNLLAAAGMGVAILFTLLLPLIKGEADYGVIKYLIILAALGIGTVIGLLASKRVAMTDMPQLVSMFNGLGGACSVAIASVELLGMQRGYEAGESLSGGVHFTTLMALFVGAVAFTGSIIAFGKLQGLIDDRKVRIPAPTYVNLTLLAIIVGLIVFKLILPAQPFYWIIAVLVLALIYGITFVIPIGGADMPVVISLLNAFSGVAGTLAGVVYGNEVMIVGGILVGSSGTILTVLMCQAMNRSLINVIVGGFGSTGSQQAATGDMIAREISLNDAATLLRYSNSVIMIPGYGMAVAQAQKTAHELEEVLEGMGVSVRYAIHPVAGRMPGHMNVLLAEADVPYPKLLDLEDANQALASTDVVIIIGANDVVNPAAKRDPGSPIYGMPILDVLLAKHTIVMKRSMNPGYAGIENPLFFEEKNRMLFGDAKKTLQSLVTEVKSLE
ncbi:MAG: NAD(P)(+) transhydrogenase (Re/Si-specific) subunit beta [Bacteroidia bacterium]